MPDNRPGYCRQSILTIVTLSNGASIQVAGINERRVRIEFAAVIEANLVNNRPLASNADGISCPANKAVVAFDYDTHGTIVQGEWHAWGTAAPSHLAVTETIEMPISPQSTVMPGVQQSPTAARD